MRARSILLALVLLSGAALWGDTIPGHFTINLNSPLACSPDTEGCTNEWGQIDFTLNFNTGLTLAGDENGPFSPREFVSPCDSCELTDPSMEMDAGGASIPITSNDFEFTADAATCPDGICSFQNATGTNWSDVLISTATSFPGGTFFECGTNLYDTCGIRQDDIQVLFTGITNSPGIPTTVPEPGTITLLLAAAGVCALGRRRKAARQQR